jgi:hypothetical protein
MASYPITLKVVIDFSSGAGTGTALILDDPVYGQLDYNVLLDAVAPLVDVSDQTIRFTSNKARNLVQDQYEAATAVVRVLDETGRFNPQNTSSDLYGYLLPLRKVLVSAVYSGTTYPIGFYYTTAYKYSYPTGQELGYVDIECVDAFRLFTNAAITTVASTSAGQDTGTRISKILDQISFPSSMRDIQTGNTTVQADPATSRTGLTAIRDVEFTEFGAFYMGNNGDAVFLNRTSTVGSIGGTPTVFNQTGSGIDYRDIKFSLDDKLIYNSASIKPNGLTAQVASDQTSIDTYFTHSLTKENLLMQTEAEALNLAQSFVASRKDTEIRIDAITLDLTTPSYNAGIIAALTLNYFSPVQITNIQPGGSEITQLLQVQGVAHEITPNTWRTTFNTFEPILDGFILNNTKYAILDTSVLSY